MTLRTLRGPFLVAAALFLAACSDTLGPLPCASDGECLPGSYCNLPSGATLGVCTTSPACTGTQTACEGACVDTQTSGSNCGMCGRVCSPPIGGTTSCGGGNCLPACASPAVLIGSACLTAPDAPGPVTAVGGADQVALTWPSDNRALTYTVKRSTVAGGPYTQAGTVNASASPSFTDTGLSGGTTYFYVVTATSPGGESPPSTEVSALTAPDAPTGAVAVPGNNTITLVWNRSPGAVSYNIDSASSSGQETLDTSLSPVADPGTGSVVTIHDTGLPNGVELFYQIEAVNPSGSATSGEVSAVTPLPEPTNLSATGSDSGIMLEWSSVAGAASYTLLRNSGSGFATLEANVTSPYIDTTSLAGVQYQYEVIALTAAATSLPSNIATAQSTLGIPGDFAGQAHVLSVSLSWDEVAGATGYDLQRSFDGNAYVHIGPNPSTAQTTYNDVNVSAGTNYKYQVCAVAGSFQGSFSAALPLTTGLDVPGNLALASPATTSSVSLSWNATADSGGYDVRRSADNGTTYSLLGATRPTTTTASYSDTSVAPGSSYLYTVASWTQDSESDQSTPLAVAVPLAAPTSLQVVSALAGNVQLSWTGSAGATGYAIFAAGTSGSFSQLGTSTGTTYTDTTAVGALSYLYYVVATHGAVSSSGSNVVTVAIPLNTPSPLAVDPATQRVVWPPSSGALGYNLEKSVDGSNFGPVNANTPSVLASAACTGSGASALCAFSETLIPANSSVYYKVQAYANPTGSSAVTSGFGGPVAVYTGVPPVTTLGSVSTTATSVNLNWTAVPGINYYNVLRSNSAMGPFVRLAGMPNAYSNGYTDTDLTPATTYYYEVQSFIGITAVSSPLAFPPATTQAATLAAPTNLTATADPSQGVVLSWTASPGASQYNVYRSDDLGATFYQIDTEGGTTDVDPNGAGAASFVEYYAIEAVNFSTPAYSPLSIPTSAFLPYPVPPTGLTATASVNGLAPQINLSWNAPPGAGSYQIWVSLDGHSWVSRGGFGGVTTYTDTNGLTFGTQYYYAIENDNSLFGSAKSTLAKVMTSSPPAPTGLVLSDNGAGLPQISWNSVANLPANGGYLVERSSDGTSFTPIGTPNLPNTVTTSFTDVTVPSNGLWYYQVAAWTPSSTGSFVIGSVQVAGVNAPVSFTASIVTTSAVTLVWSATGGLTGFNVYRSSDGGATFVQQGGNPTVAAGTFKYVDSTVQPGAVYIYRVVGLAGSTSVFTLPSAPLTLIIAPGGLQAAGGSGEVTLAWSAVAGASLYNLYRGTSPGSGGNPPGGATPYTTTTRNSYTDSSLADGTYYYAVSAVNASIGSSIPSATVNATAGSGGVTGTDVVDYYTEDFATGVTSKTSVPGDLSSCAVSNCAAWYLQNGVWTSSSGVGTWDGNFAISNVPQGNYLLQFGNSYYASSARVFDLGREELGRVNLQTITDQPTNLDLNLSGLVKATPLDIFETFSMNGRNNYFGITPAANSPAPGATTITDLVVDTYPSYGNTLLDGSQGDDLEIYQLSSQIYTDTGGGQWPVETMSRYVELQAPTQVNGVDAAVTAALTAPANTASLTVNNKNTPYDALLPQINPQAVDGWYYFGGGPFIDAQPAAASGRGNFGSQGTPDLLVFGMPDPRLKADINLGTITFASPFDPSWALWGGTSSSAAISFVLPGQQRSSEQGFTIITRDSLAALNQLGQSAAGLSPRLGPVQQVRINGGNAFFEQYGTGTTPTISWEAPALGAPNFYTIGLRQLTPGSGGGVIEALIASFATTGTQLTIPTGLITTTHGTAYYVNIEATYNPGFAIAHPRRSTSLTYDVTPMISAKFFP